MAEIIIDGATYKLECKMANCDKNLHSFKENRESKKEKIPKGCCIQCKSSLVDWDRVYEKDFDDFEYTKSALKLEMIRNIYWTVRQPTVEMKKKILALDTDDLNDKITRRLRTTLSKPRKENAWDGRQTPFDSGNLIHWAQHATGTCCRSCLEEWYGIDANRELSGSDYEYLGKVITAYLKDRTL